MNANGFTDRCMTEGEHMNREDEAWLLALIGALEALRGRDDMPHADIDWLLEQCRTAQIYPGAMLAHLRWDVREFVREFPGLLALELVPPGRDGGES